jgi:uncharacterized protein
MPKNLTVSRDANDLGPTLGYVAPFAVFVLIMSVEHALELPLLWAYAVRLTATALALVLFSRAYLSFRPSAPWASLAIGVIVFLLWIAPDVLFGYRQFWLFSNKLLGSPTTSVNPALRNNLWFLTIRVVGTSIFAPLIEELFWRGWLMRWLVDKDFLKVPLGKYATAPFWIVAILFASEHGSYWEVGLLAGIVYNWWIVRTRNLADCILAHSVTNAILAAYVLWAGQWQYWL